MLIKAEAVFPAIETQVLGKGRQMKRETEESEGGQQFGLPFQVSQFGLVGFLYFPVFFS